MHSRRASATRFERREFNIPHGYICLVNNDGDEMFYLNTSVVNDEGENPVEPQSSEKDVPVKKEEKPKAKPMPPAPSKIESKSSKETEMKEEKSEPKSEDASDDSQSFHPGDTLDLDISPKKSDGDQNQMDLFGE